MQTNQKVPHGDFLKKQNEATCKQSGLSHVEISRMSNPKLPHNAAWKTHQRLKIFTCKIKIIIMISAVVWTTQEQGGN